MILTLFVSPRPGYKMRFQALFLFILTNIQFLGMTDILWLMESVVIKNPLMYMSIQLLFQQGLTVLNLLLLIFETTLVVCFTELLWPIDLRIIPESIMSYFSLLYIFLANGSARNCVMGDFNSQILTGICFITLIDYCIHQLLILSFLMVCLNLLNNLPVAIIFLI